MLRGLRKRRLYYARRPSSPGACRIGLVAACSLLSSALFLSCGIDTIVYLSAKAKVINKSDSSFNFSGPSTSEASYQGLNLYYRIYASDTDATTDLNAIASKQGATNAVPGAYVASYLASSSGLKYQRVILVDPVTGAADPIPTFDKDELPADGYIAVSFTASGEPYVEVNLGAAHTETKRYLLRRAASNASGYLSFLTAPVSGAIDYRSGTVSANMYYVHFFAAAYGLDFVSFSELYGDAEHVGRIALNL